MGGYLGFGHSSAKTDRGNQLAATQGEWNVFNWGLPAGQQGQGTGQADLTAAKADLGPAKDYYRRLLAGGRTDTAALAAPATNAALAEKDATRSAEGTFGTGRTGGTAAANRTADTDTQSKIDQIINENLVGGRAAGAQGLESTSRAEAAIGGTELSNALSLLGLSQDAISSILSNATQSREISNKINLQTQAQWGQLLGTLLLGGFGGGGGAPAGLGVLDTKV